MRFLKRKCTELNEQTCWRPNQLICVFQLHEFLNDTGALWLDRTKRLKPQPSTRWLLILLFISVSNMTKTMIDQPWLVSNLIQKMLNSTFEKINGHVMRPYLCWNFKPAGIKSRLRFVFLEFNFPKVFFACKISDIQVNMFSQRVENSNC